MILGLLLAVLFPWPTEMEGVRIVPPEVSPPACSTVSMGEPGRVSEWDREPLCPECIEGDSWRGSTKLRRDKAILDLVLKVKERGADTVYLERVYIRNPGGTRVARGRGYRCGTDAAGGEP